MDADVELVAINGHPADTNCGCLMAAHITHELIPGRSSCYLGSGNNDGTHIALELTTRREKDSDDNSVEGLHVEEMFLLARGFAKGQQREVH